jgi:hypothetical protein
MYELALFGSGYLIGVVSSLLLFRYGMKYATTFIYRIKEDVPLEEIGTATTQEYSGTQE